MSRPVAQKIPIIGAGLSGLSCAHVLGEARFSIRVYEKGRGPGGRTSSRRADIGGTEVSFDHGAQDFFVRDPRVEERAQHWSRLGVA